MRNEEYIEKLEAELAREKAIGQARVNQIDELTCKLSGKPRSDSCAPEVAFIAKTTDVSPKEVLEALTGLCFDEEEAFEILVEINETKRRRMMDKRFLTTQYVVEATRAEQHFLWVKHNEGNVWKEDTAGLGIHVGDFNGFPVNISVLWSTINGMHTLFYHAMSRVVDHVMIEDWLKENCNPQYGGRREHCDAMNFHQMLNASVRNGPPK